MPATQSMPPTASGPALTASVFTSSSLPHPPRDDRAATPIRAFQASHSRKPNGYFAGQRESHVDYRRVAEAEAHPGSAQFLPGRPARLDDGCVRLLPGCPGLCRHRQGIRRLAGADGIPDHGDAADATGRRIVVRSVGRSGRASDPADGRCHLLLHRRLSVRLRPQLHRVVDPPPFVRHRDGWRVGSRRGAGHGEDPELAAWLLLRSAAGRVLDGATCLRSWPTR